MRLSLHLHRAFLLSAALLPGITIAQLNYTPYTFSAAKVWGLPPAGSQDGAAGLASFFHPNAVVTDSKGNAFVADTENNTIRKISADGTTVSTFAGQTGVAGSADGTGTAASFFNPAGLGVDSADNLYVSDSANDTIRMITPSGVVSTLAGKARSQGFADGTGSAARFSSPVGVTVAPNGNVYVTDTGNNIVRMITPSGVVSTLAGVGMFPSIGSTDAIGTNSRFDQPYGAVADKSGNIYVADTANDVIRRIDATTQAVTTVAGAAGLHGSVDGVGSAARFYYPAAIAIGNDGSLYVADSSNNTIRKVSIPSGTVTTLAGTAGIVGSLDGIGASAQFDHPTSLTTDASGNVYVADTYNQTIRKIDSTGLVTTFVGSAGAQGYLDASGTAARFNFPTGLAADSKGNIYEADASSEIIRKITPAGAVTTLAGLAGNSGSTDGTGSAARFRSPAGLCVDSADNIYVSDTYNCSIRKITPAGVVTTVAGIPGLKGSTNGAAATAQFNFPFGVAADSQDGSIIVVDTYNNTIRKISQANVVSTIGGAPSNAGYVDGPASSAQFSSPAGIAMDSKGNLYVADGGNNTIRKIDTSLKVTAFAGAGRLKTSGYADGSATGTARFNSPEGVAVDASDNVYVVDTGNDTIREIQTSTDSTTGVVTVSTSTPVGAAQSPGREDGAGAVSRLQNPDGIWIAKNTGNIYVADTGNNVIREVASGNLVSTLAGQGTNQSSLDGLGTAARLNFPSGIVADKVGNLYVADPGNSTVRKLTPSNGSYMVSTYAGVAGQIGSQDTTDTAVATMANPQAVALDVTGNDPSGAVYVVDSVDFTIRMIVPSSNGPIVSTPAGAAGASGSMDGTGTAATFLQPTGAAVHYNTADGTTNVYIVELSNNDIRQMVMQPGQTTNGVVTTIAGSAGTYGSLDGTGTVATFQGPKAIAIDNTGNTLYVADTGNSLIRMITLAPNASGTRVATVSTLAGVIGTRGCIDGTGSVAQFDQPTGLTVDPLHNDTLYVTDAYSQVIRKIVVASAADGSPTATVSTVAGIPSSPGYTDGAGNSVRFALPSSVTVDPTTGKLYVADTYNNTIRELTPPSAGPVTVKTVAGAPSYASFGDADGGQASARFSEPNGVAVDNAGNIYVADTLSDTVRRIDSSGNVTTLAGALDTSGSGEGTGAAAQFFRPYGVAVDANKNLYVADAINSTIRRIDPNGFVKTIAGTAGVRGSTDGVGSDASFYMPASVAIDNANNLYVADLNNSTIRKIALSGSDGSVGTVTTLAGLAGYSGYLDAAGSAARFSGPNGVAVDSAGDVYVADTGNNTIRKITPAGVVSTLAGSSLNAGSLDGFGQDAWFSGPTAVAVDAARNVYVTDSGNQLIRRVSPGGLVTTLAGTAGTIGYTNGTGSEAQFSSPSGIAVDSSGNLYVADTMNNMVRVGVPAPGSTTSTVTTVNGTTTTVVTTTVTTINGITTTVITTAVTPLGGTTTTTKSTTTSSANGTNSDLGNVGSPNSTQGKFLFIFPTSVARDASGNLYVADTANSTIQKVSTAGVVSTFAGMASVVGSADANGSNARFNQPNGIALDSNGNVFVADTGNATIRKIGSDGTVTTLAGSVSNRGNRDGTGTAAWFSSPTGIAADGSGNLYVADTFTDTIRKVTSSGTVTTVAGSPTVRGYADGTGTAALFNYPTGVAVDGSGNLYVTDSYNDLVRKITSAGVVSTLAGDYNIAAALDGNGSNAYFNQPAGLALDAAGNVYVADTGNCTIREIAPNGTVTTVAGVAGLAGLFDGAGTNALFNQPRGLVLDASGSLYVADSGNAAIRKIGVNAAVSTPAMTQGSVETITSSSVPRGSTGSDTTASSSGGGGGAISPWFLGMFALLGISRWFTRKHRA
jgi:DNA-binding beta-propeller fold protein YncE